MVTVPPQGFGRDIGPDEKYREGFWVEAILERGNQTQSYGLPRYHNVFVGRPAGFFIEEPLDESEDLFDESLIEAEVEDSGNNCTRESMDVPDYTTRYSERDRLKTFVLWKQAYHATPLDLARNGFVYRGPRDRVSCVFCRKILHKWEEGDVVEEEHRRISPNCPFVHGECDHLNKPISSTDPLGEDDRVFPKFNPPKRPAFQDLQLRKETFVNWHNVSQFSKELLSEAGFFYTGKGDCVMCHQCGVLIYQWEMEDDPWRRHAQRNLCCDFLLNRTTSHKRPSTNFSQSGQQ